MLIWMVLSYAEMLIMNPYQSNPCKPGMMSMSTWAYDACESKLLMSMCLLASESQRWPLFVHTTFAHMKTIACIRLCTTVADLCKLKCKQNNKGDAKRSL